MMQCSPKAFTKCPDRHLCAGDAVFLEGSECHKFNESIEMQPVTNADCYRAMSDDELAEFLSSITNADSWCLDDPQVKCTNNCLNCWKIFLSRCQEEKYAG